MRALSETVFGNSMQCREVESTVYNAMQLWCMDVRHSCYVNDRDKKRLQVAEVKF